MDFAYLCRVQKIFFMKALKTFFTLVAVWAVSINAWALLPPTQFTDGLFDVNPATHPSRIIVKYFAPVDKGFKVETGEPINSVLVVDMKDDRQSACWEYDLKGNLKEKYELEYNEYGVLAMVRKKDKNQNAQIREQYVYANPKNENTLKETRLYKSEDLTSMGSSVYSRDKRGNVSAIRHLDQNGKEMYSDYYTCNAEGLVENELRKDASGARRSETETAYDEDGRVISEIIYNAQGETIVQSVYTYNVNGLPDNIIQTTVERKAERYVLEYTYDERGNWIQQIVYKGFGHVPEVIVMRILSY